MTYTINGAPYVLPDTAYDLTLADGIKLYPALEKPGCNVCEVFGVPECIETAAHIALSIMPDLFDESCYDEAIKIDVLKQPFEKWLGTMMLSEKNAHLLTDIYIGEKGMMLRHYKTFAHLSNSINAIRGKYPKLYKEGEEDSEYGWYADIAGVDKYVDLIDMLAGGDLLKWKDVLKIETYMVLDKLDHNVKQAQIAKAMKQAKAR